MKNRWITIPLLLVLSHWISAQDAERLYLHIQLGHANFVTSVAFSPDGKTALSGASDGTTQLWDTATGQLRYTAIATSEGEWLAWTPEGFFAGSDWATRNLVYIVDGMSTLDIDKVYSIYYRPDLVEAKARGEDMSVFAAGFDLATLRFF